MSDLAGIGSDKGNMTTRIIYYLFLIALAGPRLFYLMYLAG